MFNSFLKNYFGFNKQQRNGLFVLLVICLLLFFIRLAIPYLTDPEPITIEKLPLVERKADSNYRPETEHTKTKQNSTLTTLFDFDPNTVSHEQLLKLGLKENTARIFVKFRAKGFIFKNKKDLLKVYGIDEKTYTRMEPYILIKEEPTQNTGSEIPEQKLPEKVPVKTELLEINSADSLSLLNLEGIGPAFSGRIIKYRTLLGGFKEVDQLKEVYGLNEELFLKIKPQLKINVALVKKMNLNKDDFKTINKHPYISYELTKTICNGRKKTPLTAENLKALINDESLYSRLLPYCTFD